MDIRKSLIATAAAGLIVTGCATSSSVDKKIAEAQARTDEKLEGVSTQVEDLQEKQRATDVKLEAIGQSANEALQRAQEAGVLAKGKVVFQQTFSEDRVKFPSNSYDLNEEARTALDELAARIKELDRPVYVEIQGFTDDRGGKSFNEMLGQRRAESVRRYLNKTHQMPLLRMSTVSYGEDDPIDSNKTRAGRAKNRRVVVVVLE
jgi:peptidoglycan-associated lipoprotein